MSSNFQGLFINKIKVFLKLFNQSQIFLFFCGGIHSSVLTFETFITKMFKKCTKPSEWTFPNQMRSFSIQVDQMQDGFTCRKCFVSAANNSVHDWNSTPSVQSSHATVYDKSMKFVFRNSIPITYVTCKLYLFVSFSPQQFFFWWFIKQNERGL